MKKIVIITLLFICTINVMAQHPWMIKDINATSTSTFPSPVGNNSSDPVNPYSPQNYISVNGITVFIANDGISGNGDGRSGDALWRSDGTTAGTFSLLSFGASNYAVTSMYETQGLMYFTVSNTNQNSLQSNTLWRTDGTVAGTFQILSNEKHFLEYALCQKYYSTSAAVIGSEFYFMVTDTLPDIGSYPNIHDRVYKTDGTINGTSIYYDSPGSHWNGYQSNGNHTISTINQINASGNNLYINYSTTILGVDYNNITQYPTSLARGDGVNPPITIFTPPVGPNGGLSNMNITSTADANGNYLLLSGTITEKIGVYRLYANETTPVWIDTSNINVSFVTQTNDLFNPAIGNRFFYRAASGKLKVTDGTIAGTYNFEEPNTTNGFSLGGIGNNKILVNNGSHSFFWDGASPTSYVEMDSLGVGTDGIVFQSNNKLFYLGDQSNIAWTSELDGSNFLRVFYYYGSARGALTPNGYVVQLGITGAFNSFDAGYEPGIFKTHFKIFTGNLSHDWSTAGNWSPAGVPLATDDVVIPSLNTAKLPVITTAATCKNFTICNSLLTITGANLNINGNVANYLSTITGTGSVTFKSTTGAKISGNAFLDVANVYINGTDVGFGTKSATFNSVVTF